MISRNNGKTDGPAMILGKQTTGPQQQQSVRHEARREVSISESSTYMKGRIPWNYDEMSESKENYRQFDTDDGSHGSPFEPYIDQVGRWLRLSSPCLIADLTRLLVTFPCLGR